MTRILFMLILVSVCCCSSAADNAARSIRLRGFKGLWLSPQYPFDRGDALTHWKLNEAQGNNRIDSADSKPLEEHGLVPASAGKIGDAPNEFVAATAWLEPLSFYTPTDSDFSFSGWVWFTSHVNGQTPIQWCHDGECYYSISSDGTNLKWGVSSNGTSISTSVTSAWALTNNVWYFFACYHDSVNNVIGISVNNETVVTASHGGGIGTTPGTQGFRVGIGDGAVYFNGRVDSTTYWKRVLSASDISKLYNNNAGLDYPFPP